MSWYMSVSKCVLAGSVLLLGAGCGGREKVAIAAKDEQIRNQQSQIAQAEAEKARLAEANAQLAAQNDDMAKRQAAIVAENNARMAEMSKQVADLESIMKGMDSRFQQVKPGQGTEGLAWERGADGSIKITVASSVLFDSGRADLKSSAHSMLKNVGASIKKNFPNNYIRVEGHTDGTPVVRNKDKFADNMALSIARSRAVYDFMIKDGGIAANRMYTAGYGEHQPLIYPEKTATDRAKNRRVEIVIMPDNVKIQKDYAAAAVKRK